MNILDVNDLLFSQMERLHNAGKDDIADEAARSKELAHLAGEIVDNSRLAMQLATLQARAQSELACSVTMEQTLPARLLGGEGGDGPAAGAGMDDVDAFLAENAAAHTASWLADRLAKRGIAIGIQGVRERCEALGVEPVRLS